MQREGQCKELDDATFYSKIWFTLQNEQLVVVLTPENFESSSCFHFEKRELLDSFLLRLIKLMTFIFNLRIMNIVKQYKSEKLFLNILDSLINYFYR